eukprot:gene13554-18183_t
MFLTLLGANWTLTLNSITGMKYNTAYTSTSLSLTFLPYPCNFLGVQRLKIKSTVLKTDNVDTFSNGRSNLLTTIIPVSSAPYGLIVYNNLVGLKNILPNMNIDFIDITVTEDESDNIINFNGIDIYLTLQIDTIRENIPEEGNLLSLMEETQ